VWPIEERPAPASTVPGERAFPTQPVPTKPPAFDRQGLTVDDLIDFTPELRAEAVAIMRKYVTGPMFTPPSVAGPGPEDTKGTIQLPGSVGGADWTGAAFDPETGMLYVPSMTNPFVANLLPGDPAQTDLRFRASTRELIQGPRGLPLTKPPYGRITAFDLNRGELAWTVANGDGPRNHPLLQSLNLPPLGQSVRAAPLVTKTLLFVSEGDQINVRTPPNGGGRKLRAFDKATGRVVWETELDAGTTGTLMTYVHNRRQYIVVAIGGQNHPGEFVAFATGSTTPTSAQAPSTPQPGSVFLEDLTWIEVRDAIAAGKTTIIIPTGGTEQNGPHMVLGKHNVLVRHKAGEIATQLGNALVAPVVAYVPEGDVSPPTGHMRFAGTITTPQDVFMKVLEYAARSFRQHGFTDIALVGDSGGNQEGQRLVAEALNKEWAATSARVHHVTAYYPGRGDDWVVSQGVSKEDVGTHAGTHDTSSLMYLNPSMLRVDRLQPGKTGDGQGHVGNPARATALFGKRILEMQIEDAARQIRELRVGSRRCGRSQ
jgi:creatinine amidohydrolase/Fe(II)-dependent formamide hydrolase-like protein